VIALQRAIAHLPMPPPRGAKFQRSALTASPIYDTILAKVATVATERPYHWCPGREP
jgi:hypothetical protein